MALASLTDSGFWIMMTRLKIAGYTMLLTSLVEALTVFSRFGLGMQSTRDTASTVGVLTGGLRLHHGYFGILFAAAAVILWKKRASAAEWLLIVGLSVVLSDLAHHYLVLWPITGDPEFHIFYPVK